MKMRDQYSFAPRLVALCAALLTAGAPVGAWTQEQGAAAQAELLDVEATGLFKKGDFQQALLKFKEAYAIYPNVNSAWNIARCFEELGELHQAIAAFDFFTGVKGVNAQERQAARDKIVALHGRIRDASSALILAQSAHERGEWMEAAVSYKESLALHVTPEALLGLADALGALGRGGLMREALRDYLALPNLSLAQRLAGQERLAALDRQDLAAEQPDALTPAAEAGINQGRRVAGEAQTHARALPRRVEGEVQPPEAHPPLAVTDDTGGGGRVAGWLLLGLGAASLGVGAWGAWEVGQINGEIVDLGRDDDLSREQIVRADALPGEGETMQLVEFIGFGVGVAATLTGVVLLVLDDGAAEAPAPVAWSLVGGLNGRQAQLGLAHPW